MRRSLVRSLLAVFVIAIVVGVFYVSRADAPGRHRQTSSSTLTAKSNHAVGFYLVIGASASLGTQPDGIPARNGHRTKTGYSDDLVKLEAANGIALTMREIGCPGETMQRILGQLKDACYTLPITQLSIATKYLRAHLGEVGLVTLDLGFNNIRPCLTLTLTNQSCVNHGIVAVRNDLPTIVSRLQRAAGPLVHFVGLEYSDPYLAYYLDGSAGRVTAQQGLVAMNEMNSVLSTVYRARSVQVADVPAAFLSSSVKPVTMTNVGTVPENVARACAGSWMCTAPPFGPDDHPNNTGYLIIARTIAAQLPRTW